MARYKHIDTSPRFIAVDLQKQLLPGTIEHALNYLLDHQIDLTGLWRFAEKAAGKRTLQVDCYPSLLTWALPMFPAVHAT